MIQARHGPGLTPAVLASPGDVRWNCLIIDHNVNSLAASVCAHEWPAQAPYISKSRNIGAPPLIIPDGRKAADRESRTRRPRLPGTLDSHQTFGQLEMTNGPRPRGRFNAASPQARTLPPSPPRPRLSRLLRLYRARRRSTGPWQGSKPRSFAPADRRPARRPNLSWR